MRVLIATLLCLASCGGARSTDPAPPQRSKPLLCVASYPLAYCTERIAGDWATVECVVPTGEDPLHWRPDREAIAHLQGADLIVLNGAGAEPWAFHSSLPLSRVVDSSKAFEDRFLETAEAVTHSHGSGQTHTHAAVDPHTWTDPRLLEEQAFSVLEALIRRLPEREPALREGFGTLAGDLRQLRDELRALGARNEGLRLAVADDSYRYLARLNDWRLVELGLEASGELSDDEVAAVQEALAAARADGDPVRVLLWASEPNESTRARLRAELSIESVVFSPAARAPESGGPDFLATMRANVERLARALDA